MDWIVAGIIDEIANGIIRAALIGLDMAVCTRGGSIT